MPQSEEYKRRVNSFQKSVLTLQLFLMVLGGGIFILGVICRPILRLTHTEQFHLVKWIIDMMVAAGLIQIVAACYDVFCSCWKLMWPLYLGIAVTTMTVFLELSAMGTSLFLYTKSTSMVNEDLIHPWYWVECLKYSSCHDRMLGYIHWYILPQVLLAALSVILQCATVIILGKMVKYIVQHHQYLHEVQERYHDEWEEKQFNTKQEKEIEKGESTKNIELSPEDSPQMSESDTMRTPPRRVQFDEMEMSPMGSARKRRGGDQVDMMPSTSSYQATIRVEISSTPASIMKEDHGYVAGDRLSLDMDDL